MAGEPDAHPSDNGFEVVRRGYDQGQVETHLRRLDAEVRILVTDRDAAIDQSAQLARELDEARSRAERLRTQVRSLVSPPQSVQGMSERMRSMLRLAEDEVAEMLARADDDVRRRREEVDAHAEQVLTAARGEAAALLGSARAEAESVRAEARAEAEHLVQDHARGRTELDEERRMARELIEADRTAAEEKIAADLATSTRQRADAWAKSEARRALVEDDFAIAMNRRRSDALAQLTAQRAEIRREVDQMRGEAVARARAETEQARAAAEAIVADAHREVTDLRALRGRIVEQLTGTRSALGNTLDALEPLAEEQRGAATEPTATPVPTRAESVNGARQPNASEQLDGPVVGSTNVSHPPTPSAPRRPSPRPATVPAVPGVTVGTPGSAPPDPVARPDGGQGHAPVPATDLGAEQGAAEPGPEGDRSTYRRRTRSPRPERIAVGRPAGPDQL